jgi:hypothetical protein
MVFTKMRSIDYETDEPLTFEHAIVDELLADAQSFLGAARNWLAENDRAAKT